MKLIKYTLTAFLFAAVAMTTAVSVFADQAAWITKAQAEKAATFLKKQKEIRHYCAPCSDKGDSVEDISSVEAVKIDGQEYWEVQVNGKGIDLAYVYFKTKKGKWKNLAKEVKVKVSDVPKTLSAE